ncbi:DNA-binding pseudobarrel domain-containing protein, partial [Tanacetum coccineum]
MGHLRPPSFYHILMNPSSPHLPLPLKFVKKHLRNKILKKPILKSANGGYLWKLKMKKIDDHTFCFVDGWCKVVKDVGLLFGEFLLFKYVGSSVFLMHVYSVNGCEKILVPRINNYKVVDEVSVFEDDEEVVFDDDDDDDEVEDEVEDDDVEYDVEEDDEDVAEEDEEEDDDEVELGDDDDEVEDEVEDDDVEYDVEEDDEDVAEEDEEEDDDEVELGDDDDEDDGEDEDDVDVDGDDGDPFFVITSSKRNKNKL